VTDIVVILFHVINIFVGKLRENSFLLAPNEYDEHVVNNVKWFKFLSSLVQQWCLSS